MFALLDEKEDTGKPVIRLFGVNAAGNSVAAHVHNFTAYFYIHIVENNVTLDPGDIEKFRLKLNRECQAKDACVQIDIVDKYPVMHYQPQQQKFLKVYVSHPKFIPQLRTVVERGMTIADRDCLSETSYESNMPFALRFMIDNEIGGMTWIRIEKGQWRVRHPRAKETTCQIELDVDNYNHVACLPCEGEYSRLAPLRILSFDIECAADAGRFPTPLTDPVI